MTATTVDSLFNYVPTSELADYITLYINAPERAGELLTAINKMDSRDIMALVTVANLFRHDSSVLSRTDSVKVAEMVIAGKLHHLRVISSHANLISSAFTFSDFASLTNKLIDLGFLGDDAAEHHTLPAHVEVYSEHIDRGIPYIHNDELIEYVQQEHAQRQDILNFIRSYRSSDVQILKRHLNRSN